MIDQGELFDIPSPCKRICEVNNRGYCKGCFRSRTERLNWLKYTDFQRQLIINLCEKRRLKVLNAKLNPPTEEDEAETATPQADLFSVTETGVESEMTVPDSVRDATPTISESQSEPLIQQDQTSLFTDQVTTEAEQSPEPKKEKVQSEEKEAEGPKPEPSNHKPGKKSARKAKGNDDQMDMFS